MTPKKNEPDLTPEQEAQWLDEAGLAAPLKSKERAQKPQKIKEKFVQPKQPIRADMPRGASDLAPISQGEYAGVDKSLRERFRKGKLAVDATLDLHGQTRSGAHDSVINFIHFHYEYGNRMLLIITGKGKKEEGEARGIGVLKAALPDWLSDSSLRPFILAFDNAAVKDGGSGATYVLLKKRHSQ